MAMTSLIRFRVAPKVESRALRVLKLRNTGRANTETISDFGREGFVQRLEAEERALGIAKPSPEVKAA